MLKTFEAAMNNLAHQRKLAQPIECPLLQHRAGAHAPTDKREPMTTWERGALARIMELLDAHQPSLARALRAVPLPLELRLDEGLHLGYDNVGTSRQYIQVELETPTNMMASQQWYQSEATKHEQAQRLVDDLAKLAGWRPLVINTTGYPKHQSITSDVGARYIAATLAHKLAGPKLSDVEASAEKMGASTGALPARLRLAAQAPPMPAGWVPVFGMLEPSKPRPQEYGADALGVVFSEADAKRYRTAIDAWAQEVTAFRMMVATRWPLAWADSMLLVHAAQQ